MPDKPSFEIWPELHELAERNVEQARSLRLTVEGGSLGFGRWPKAR